MPRDDDAMTIRCVPFYTNQDYYSTSFTSFVRHSNRSPPLRYLHHSQRNTCCPPRQIEASNYRNRNAPSSSPPVSCQHVVPSSHIHLFRRCCHDTRRSSFATSRPFAKSWPLGQPSFVIHLFCVPVPTIPHVNKDKDNSRVVVVLPCSCQPSP